MKKKLLIVDDESAMRMLLCRVFGSDEYEVYEAGDGVEGLEMARREQPELVVLDVQMPRLDGLEVCRILKDDPTTRDIAVVMLTGRASAADRQMGLQAGADDYLVKPVTPLKLLTRV